MRRNMKDGILPNACRLCPSYTGRPDPVGKAQEEAWRASPVVVPVVVAPPRKRNQAQARPRPRRLQLSAAARPGAGGQNAGFFVAAKMMRARDEEPSPG